IPALSSTRRRDASVQFPYSSSNGAVSQTGRRTDSGNAAPTQGDRLHSCPTASRELRQIVAESPILALDPLNNTPIHDERHSVQRLQLLSRPISSTYLRADPNGDCGVEIKDATA